MNELILRFKNRVRFLASTFRVKHPGVADALRVILTPEDYSQVRALLSQQGDDLERVSEKLGISCEDLLQEVAFILRIPIAQHIPIAHFFAAEDPAVLRAFREAGALPLLHGGSVKGVICADPALYFRLFSRSPRVQLYLAAWSKIKEALDRSAAVYTACVEEQRSQEKKRDRENAEAVLSGLVKEAERYGASQAEILIDAGGIHYQFYTRDAKKAVGEIEPQVRAGLLCLLKEIESASCREFKTTEGDVRFFREIVFHPEESGARLSWKKSEAALRGEPAPLQSGNALNELRKFVLVIDDNQTFTRVLERFLERQGLKTLVAADGKEAFSFLSATDENPVAIICDIHMPRMNGFEFLGEYRKLKGGRIPVPVIMLTSDADIETKVKVLSDGAAAFISKEEDPRVLSAYLKTLISEEGSVAPQ